MTAPTAPPPTRHKTCPLTCPCRTLTIATAVLQTVSESRITL